MDEKRVSRLIESIYAASSDSASWRRVSEQLGQFLHGSSIIFLHDYRSASVRALALEEVEPSAVDAYQARFAGRNPVIPRALMRPEGISNSIEALLDRNEFDRSTYYNEWFRPNGFHHSTGIALRVNDASSLFLTFFRGRGDGEYSAEAHRLLESLVPHLRQSVEIGLRLEQAASAATELQHALSRAGTAAFVLDCRGAIFEANVAAQELLQSEPAFRLTAGRLVCTSDKHIPLARLLRGAIEHRRHERFVIRSSASSRHYLATAIPSVSSGMWLTEPTALLLVDSPRAAAVSGSFERIHKLTPAETKLLLALIKGESVNEYCSRTELSRNTVKTQLSSLFSKTGTAKQKDLVRAAVSAAP